MWSGEIFLRNFLPYPPPKYSRVKGGGMDKLRSVKEPVRARAAGAGTTSSKRASASAGPGAPIARMQCCKPQTKRSSIAEFATLRGLER